jgi:phosphoribosyl 1,2-cyclic phosphate phosphodiesterase
MHPFLARMPLKPGEEILLAEEVTFFQSRVRKMPIQRRRGNPPRHTSKRAWTRLEGILILTNRRLSFAARPGHIGQPMEIVYATAADRITELISTHQVPHGTVIQITTGQQRKRLVQFLPGDANAWYDVIRDVIALCTGSAEEHTIRALQQRQQDWLSQQKGKLYVEFLGSGGAITTPRPGCTCPVCAEARAKGVPYSRTGPSVFVHGPDVLIDTPEESKAQIDRSRIAPINACFYSHWHPDHVAGRRVWETMNGDWLRWPPNHHRTTIYLPQQVAQDFRTYLGAWEQFMYLQRFGVVQVIELTDGDIVTRGETQIRPFRLAEDYVYAFLFEQDGTRVLIAPDELFGWEPPAEVRGVDLAVIPMGLTRIHPLTGAQVIPDNHPVLKAEATFSQTLDIVRKLDAKRVIMTHIEEAVRLSYDDLLRLEAKLHADGYPITFAYDTMLVEV